MSALKRKAEKKPEKTSKRRNSSDVKNESKSLKTDRETSPIKERTRPTNSILVEEERAFPRGGGTDLTPVERRQIQIKADRDVLFEESGQKPAPAQPEDSDVDEDDDFDEEKPQAKRRRISKKVQASTLPAKDPHIKVEGLKTKNMLPGSLILGCISKITDHELTLDLPNNLSGTVPITAISTQLTQKLQAALAEDEKETQDDAASDVDQTDLRHHFHLGQYLRSSVISTLDPSSEKLGVRTRKRIELSINPCDANRGLSSDALPINAMIQASIASVEDHGLVMDLGLAEGDVRGFVSSKDIPPALDYSQMYPGMVLLCRVTGLGSNGRVIKLSANPRNVSDSKKGGVLTDTPTINALLPGAIVDVLITQTTISNLAGSIMGLVDASADSLHCGAGPRKLDAESTYKIGSKHKARIIFRLEGSEKPTVGISFLSHLVHMAATDARKPKHIPDTMHEIPVSKIIDSCEIVNANSRLGLYLNVGIEGAPAFVHLSRISDEHLGAIEKTHGPLMIGTKHQVRILGYNAIDQLYLASMQKSVLSKRFLRVDDVPIGEIVKGTISDIKYTVGEMTGLIVELSEGLTGLVPEMHMADIHLSHPERKFKKGLSVTARVLSTYPEKGQIRLSLKKILVNSELPLWKEYANISVGDRSMGTIVNLTDKGAFLQFYGNVRAFLPVSEFSDGYVEDAKQHFRIGHALTVRATTVDIEAQRMTVSNRSDPEKSEVTEGSSNHPKVGDVVHGLIAAKSEQDFTIILDETQSSASLNFSQLTDGPQAEDDAAANKIRVGRHLKDLVVIDIHDRKQSVTLSKRPKLVKSAKAGHLITSLDKVVQGETVVGYIHNITEKGVFVRFVEKLTALLPRSQIPDELLSVPNFGFSLRQSLECRVLAVYLEDRRFSLTMKEPLVENTVKPEASNPEVRQQAFVNPIDESLKSIEDLMPGKTTRAKIKSIKGTQLNVILADRVHGRIDVSEAFQSPEDVKDIKRPMNSFKRDDIIPVRVLGIHDTRNHRFLPISHRAGGYPVFELSTRLEESASILSADRVKQGEKYKAFVNNIAGANLWVNISPAVRGRISRRDMPEDIAMATDLGKHYQRGQMISVWLKKLDVTSGYLELTTKSPDEAGVTFEQVSVGDILVGRVTKIQDRHVVVHLSENAVGAIPLTELADDFEKADTSKMSKGEMVRVCVVDVDAAKKRVTLSSRPSKVLSSTLSVDDPSVTSFDQLHKGDIVRGFIQQTSPIGVFVMLGAGIKGFVPITDLSDEYVKDWQPEFPVNKLVSGRITLVDPVAQQAHLSLKKSALVDGYEAPLQFSDVKKGQEVSGWIRKVEDFGAIIVVDNSQNVSGLCHRNNMAEREVEDARKLYSEGDKVKARVVKVDPKSRRISFSMKSGDVTRRSKKDVRNSKKRKTEEDVESLAEDPSDDDGGGVSLLEHINNVNDANVVQPTIEPHVATTSEDEGLSAPFDWNPDLNRRSPSIASSAPSSPPPAKKRKRRADPYEDHTADVAEHGPQKPDDFERLLLGDRDNPTLWIQYMSYYVSAGSIEDARKVADRATKNVAGDTERLDVWTAWLNLELCFGDEDADQLPEENDDLEANEGPVARLPLGGQVKEIFTSACKRNDRAQLTDKLVRSLTHFKKRDAAARLYDYMSHDKEFTDKPDFWIRYARFLMRDAEPQKPEDARALVPRATQILHQREHAMLLLRFAQLEFQLRPDAPDAKRKGAGDPERGRTLFTDLLSLYPTRWDFWDVWLSLESSLLEKMSSAEHEARLEQEGRIRDLFERQISIEAPKMKKKRAGQVFERWLAFEEGAGSGSDKSEIEKTRRMDKVRAKKRKYFETRLGRDE